MNPARRVLPTLFVLAILFSSGDVCSVVGQEMRIETDVYVGDDDEPVSHTVTLFDAGTVYDFVDIPKQIAVFRPPNSSRAGQFVLLDLESEQRTDVTTERIQGLMNKLTRWAGDQDDKMLKFSAEPVFEEAYEAETGRLTLQHELWNYTVATIPAEDQRVLSRYREFIDWYTRLNTMVHGAPPPGPRLALNAALAKHGVVPVEIRRQVEGNAKTLRATHLFAWRLSRDDRARLEQARKYLASFEKVDNQQFIARRGGKDLVRGQSR